MLIRWVEDQILAWIQQRCSHPDKAVAADILEGAHDEMHVSYCRRCGAVRVERDWRFIERHEEWRLPDPNLWRG
jgi:NMD protein affecting ribosome stability and mRNA decay